jgi:hypothetical protein
MRRSLIVLLIVAVLGLVPLASMSFGATTTKLAWISLYNSKWRNFDFTTTTDSRTKVDWAVDFIYFGNASVDKVRSAMTMFLPCQSGICQSEMHMHLSTDSGVTLRWQTSSGMKQSVAACTPGTNLHQRVYAPDNTSFYNRSWGHYIIGTTHYDVKEFCGGWSGKSERAERMMCFNANYVFQPNGGYCWYDAGPNLRNAMPNVNVNGHWWMNDGRSTYTLVK